MLRALTSLALLLSCLNGAMANEVPKNVATELAPTGTLRAAINFGNSVLAQKDPAGGAPRGVSGELTRELARRLDLPIAYVTFDAAGKVFDAIKTGAWDVAFLAIIPGRFMAIEQAMGTVKGRLAGARYLRQFVEEMKASGFVAKALKDSGQGDAAVAPPTPVQ